MFSASVIATTAAFAQSLLTVQLAAPAPPTAASPPTAAPPSAAPTAAPTSAPPPTASAAPPTSAPPPTSAAPATQPDPAEAENGGWGAEDESPPPLDSPGADATPVVAAPVVTPATTYPAPDAALLQRNRQLSQQMQRGERWLIGGRLGAPLSLLPLAIGVGMLGAHSARRASYRDGFEERPPGNGLLVAGGAITVLGLAGLGTSIYAAIHGFQLMNRARNGQLVVGATRQSAAVAFQMRF